MIMRIVLLPFSARISPVKGYVAMSVSSTNRDVLPTVANMCSLFVLPHFGKKTVGGDSQCNFCKIFQETSGCKLVAPVPKT